MDGLHAVNGEAAHIYSSFLDTRQGGYYLAILVSFLLPLLRVLLDNIVYVVRAHTHSLPCVEHAMPSVCVRWPAQQMDCILGDIGLPLIGDGVVVKQLHRNCFS